MRCKKIVIVYRGDVGMLFKHGGIGVLYKLGL